METSKMKFTGTKLTGTMLTGTMLEDLMATVERADASFPDRLNCSGTVVIRDFPPRFPARS